MFQIEWANKELANKEIPVTAEPSGIDKHTLQRILNLRWEEHCVECAVPECYTSCNLYKPRQDGACARFVYGIYPNSNVAGHFDFGADITFRKWAKLEADLNQSFPGNVILHARQHSYTSLTREAKTVIRNKFRNKYAFSNSLFDAFVVECYSPQPESFNFILEYFTEVNRFRKTQYRSSFVIKQGYNYFSVPFADFKMNDLEGYIYLYPESHEPEKRLIFTWLDFVKFKNNESNDAESSPKVKCVAWDLDNTLWHGILSEDKDVILIEHVAEVIKQLDERGILQTIVSKNDFDPAWQKLKEFELDHYFLYPAINWSQKSENIKGISKKLNISIDTFAIIDDSLFERDEIKSALPQVRTYSEKQITEILSYKEFDFPITTLSKKRRESYFTEQVRDNAKTIFTGTYDEFLESCEMKITAFVPTLEDDILRCWELVQRSNQLNLSTNRYSREEFKNLLSKPDVMSLALRCTDRYGDYGIVGFSSTAFLTHYPILIDFVLSCRVAQKKIEHAFIKKLSALLYRKGYEELAVKFIKTAKNKPLLQVFDDLPFFIIDDTMNVTYLRLDLTKPITLRDIMEFEIDDSNILTKKHS
jgi:FkbH-like protein